MKNPHTLKIHVALGSAAIALTLLFAIGVQAQSDNFDDGDDTAPVAWMENDAIFTIFGAGVGPQCSWGFPGGNAYELQAVPSPAPTTMGTARVSSFPPDIYSDFYVSVDVVAWDSTFYQAFGMLARAGDFSTAGHPTTRGYGFIYVDGPLDKFIAIFRLRGDASTSGVHGSSGNTAEVHGVALDPNKPYRFIFIGKGTHMEGRIYDLADLTTPVAVVSANAAGETPLHTSGQCGLFAFNVASAGFGQFAGPVDVTFDNYSAREADFTDNFNDGNDTDPAWDHYDALGSIGAADPASFDLHDGAYQITMPVAIVTDYGPARGGSILSGSDYGDFYASVDVLDWDDTVRQVFGILARANDVGLGTTTGYLFSYELGSDALPNETGGDTDISALEGEAPHDVPTGPSSIHLTKGKQYRLVFIGKGSDLTGQVYDLTDLTTPLLTITGTDTRFERGRVGLVVASQSSPVVGGNATFDNFHVDGDEPQPSISVDGNGAVIVTWPAQLAGIWVLESSSSLEPGAVWAEITANNVVYAAGQNIHTQTSPGASAYYRLRKI